MLGLFTLAIFVGAGLLFLVQPMVAKMLLPGLGGSPSVWNTCMVFFQAALLAGYAYAHRISRISRARAAVALHAVVLLIPLGALWLGGPGGRSPSGEAAPVLWLLMTLAVTVGLPFMVVATGGPLLQRWFAATTHARARDPYFLYAASNAGSLLALLAYPLIVERLIGLDAQWRLWSVGYIAWIVLVLVCGLVVIRAGSSAPAAADRPQAQPVDSREPDIPATRWEAARERLLWIALACVPSSLMLGVTQYLSTDIAAVPLLWVIPLAIYLATFMLAFARHQILPALVASRWLAILAIALMLVFFLEAKRPIAVLIAIHLSALFLAGMVCHGRLAQLRPRTSRLTEYYLLIAVGGVLGGMFNALASPVIFTGIYEYPIALVAACLLRPSPADDDKVSTPAPARGSASLGYAVRIALGLERGPRSIAMTLDLAMPLALAVVMLAIEQIMQVLQRAGSPLASGYMVIIVRIGVPAFVLFLLSRRPVRFALAFGVMLAVAHWAHGVGTEKLHASRTFFGVHRVRAVHSIEPGRVIRTITQLFHGTTVHGLQDWSRPDEPLAYYHRAGPIGQTFAAFRAIDEHALRRVGLIGLGAGAMATYRRAGDHFVFFEIDPEVVRIARNDEWFTYLRDAEARGGEGGIDIILGDGRLTLAAHSDSFDILVLDAFTSDAIPTHLLTREAVEMYLTRLKPGGMIAFHISNRYISLEPVLAAVAADMGLAGRVQNDSPIPAGDASRGRYDSNWVILARTEQDLGPISADGRWLPLTRLPGLRAWTDDYSNIIRVFDWGLSGILRDSP